MTTPISCFHPLKPLPSFSLLKFNNFRTNNVSFSINCTHKLICNLKPSLEANGSISMKPSNNEFVIKSNWLIQMGILATTQLAEPAMAVTGVNHEEELIWVLLKVAVVAFGYFLVMPPIIMNWLRIRWYRRKLPEMYLQFMFVFVFFPGILVWAPFLNFRKFPRDPTLKYPWSKSEKNPSAVKGGFLKFPWATIEDYE